MTEAFAEFTKGLDGSDSKCAIYPMDTKDLDVLLSEKRVLALALFRQRAVGYVFCSVGGG
jgi:hypothetical protein